MTTMQRDGDEPFLKPITGWGHEDETPHSVYIHLDGEQRVLYVGCTKDLAQRTRTHQSKSAWWPQVAEVRTVGTWGYTLARGVERGLIAQYDPPGNFVGTLAWRQDVIDRHNPNSPRTSSRAVAKPLATPSNQASASAERARLRAAYEAYAAGNEYALTYLSWRRRRSA